MKTYTVTEGKAQLSALIQRVVKTGKPVVIGRHGRPLVQLAPYLPNGPRRLGTFAGQIRVADDFDVWPAEEAKALGITE